MDAKEAQLQYMHLYKEMDASYYALSCAQQLVPSEMDIYYAITVLGDGCRQRDICALALSRKQIINSALKKMEKQGLLRRSIGILSVGALLLTAAGELMASLLANIFVSYDAGLLEMTRQGFRIYSLSYLICGFSIFGSAFFTALNNGLVSAVISFVRTLVFQIICVLVLPLFLELNGVWSSIIVAEFLGVVVTVVLLIANRKKYHYFRSRG